MLTESQFASRLAVEVARWQADGRSARALAVEAGLDPALVHRIRYGQQPPSAMALTAIVNALRCDRETVIELFNLAGYALPEALVSGEAA